MINNGVYRAGFARTQEAYDIAVNEVFAGLDKVSLLYTIVLEKQDILNGRIRFSKNISWSMKA